MPSKDTGTASHPNTFSSKCQSSAAVMLTSKLFKARAVPEFRDYIFCLDDKKETIYLLLKLCNFFNFNIINTPRDSLGVVKF